MGNNISNEKKMILEMFLERYGEVEGTQEDIGKRVAEFVNNPVPYTSQEISQGIGALVKERKVLRCIEESAKGLYKYRWIKPEKGEGYIELRGVLLNESHYRELGGLCSSTEDLEDQINIAVSQYLENKGKKNELRKYLDKSLQPFTVFSNEGYKLCPNEDCQEVIFFNYKVESKDEAKEYIERIVEIDPQCLPKFEKPYLAHTLKNSFCRYCGESILADEENQRFYPVSLETLIEITYQDSKKVIVDKILDSLVSTGIISLEQCYDFEESCEVALDKQINTWSLNVESDCEESNQEYATIISQTPSLVNWSNDTAFSPFLQESLLSEAIIKLLENINAAELFFSINGLLPVDQYNKLKDFTNALFGEESYQALALNQLDEDQMPF